MTIKTEFSEYIKSKEGQVLLTEVGMNDDAELLKYIDGNYKGSEKITQNLKILLETLALKLPSREEYIMPIIYTLKKINGGGDLETEIQDLFEKGWYYNGCVDSILHELYIHKTEKDGILDICTKQFILELDTIRRLFQVTYKPEDNKKERDTILFTKSVNIIDNEVQYSLYNNIQNNYQYRVLGEKTDLETFNNKRKEKIIEFENIIKEELTNKEWYRSDIHDNSYTKDNYFINDTFEKIVKNK